MHIKFHENLSIGSTDRHDDTINQSFFIKEGNRQRREFCS